MRVIDFVGLGAENTIYVITNGNRKIDWRGTRQDFVREMSAFFLFFHHRVTHFEIEAPGVLVLHI